MCRSEFICTKFTFWKKHEKDDRQQVEKFFLVLLREINSLDQQRNSCMQRFLSLDTTGRRFRWRSTVLKCWMLVWKCHLVLQSQPKPLKCRHSLFISNYFLHLRSISIYIAFSLYRFLSLYRLQTLIVWL